MTCDNRRVIIIIARPPREAEVTGRRQPAKPARGAGARLAPGGGCMAERRGSVLPGWAEDWLVRAGPLAVLAGMVAVFLPGLVCFAVTGDGARAKAVLKACVGWGLPALLVVNGASVVSMAWWKVGTIPPDRLTRWLSCGGAAVQWSMAAGIVGLQAGGPVAGARAGLLAARGRGRMAV